MENAGQKLLTDPKNLLEHDIVVQKIKRNLLEKAETVTVGTTELMELKNVYHLRTILSAKILSFHLLIGQNSFTQRLLLEESLVMRPSNSSESMKIMNEDYTLHLSD